MAARRVIGASAYALSQLRGDQWVEVAVLHGGAAALLPTSRPVDEASLEAAIASAEDWLMPHARSIQGEDLDVVDDTGRLASGVTAVLSIADREWSMERLEEMFSGWWTSRRGAGPRSWMATGPSSQTCCSFANWRITRVCAKFASAPGRYDSDSKIHARILDSGPIYL